MTSRCAACATGPLEPHLAVAGELGSEGLIPTTDRFGTALADIVRCRSCGHMQLDPLPAAERLEREYEIAESDDYVVEEQGQRATARFVLERLARHQPSGSLLDVGCWVGFLLAEARGMGWRPVVGVEPSRFASEFARDRLGLDVRTGGLFDVDLGAARFDAIFMGDVIEHLPDPATALTRLDSVLADGGTVALALPDAGSRVARVMGRRWWSVIPTHVHYFTRESLRILLERRGFELCDVTTAPKAFTVRYYLERTAGYSPRLSRMLVRGAQATGTSGRTWAPDFRDRMLAIARRRGGRSPGAGG